MGIVEELQVRDILFSQFTFTYMILICFSSGLFQEIKVVGFTTVHWKESIIYILFSFMYVYAVYSVCSEITPWVLQ